MTFRVEVSPVKGANRATCAAGLVALLVIADGCSDGTEGPASSGHMEGPESVAKATLHAPVGPPVAGRAAAQWRRPGTTVAVTLWGSGSCPPVPADINVDGHEGRITLRVSDDYEYVGPGVGACTDDLSPATYLVRLPNRLNPSQPAVLIVQEHGRRDVRIPLAPIGSNTTTGSRCPDVSGQLVARSGVLSAGPFSAEAIGPPPWYANGTKRKLWVASRRPGHDDVILTVTPPPSSTRRPTTYRRPAGEAFVPDVAQFYAGDIDITGSRTWRLDITVGRDHMCVRVAYETRRPQDASSGRS